MTHDILSVKLYELDKAIGQMHSRIEQGEMDCPEQVEKDIQEEKNDEAAEETTEDPEAADAEQ